LPLRRSFPQNGGRFPGPPWTASPVSRLEDAFQFMKAAAVGPQNPVSFARATGRTRRRALAGNTGGAQERPTRRGPAFGLGRGFAAVGLVFQPLAPRPDRRGTPFWQRHARFLSIEGGLSGQFGGKAPAFFKRFGALGPGRPILAPRPKAEQCFYTCFRPVRNFPLRGETRFSIQRANELTLLSCASEPGLGFGCPGT